MIGLLKKDVLTQKKTLLILLILLAFYIILFWNQFFSLYLFFALLNLLVIISAFALDEQAKWDSFAISLPVSRGDIVAARYLLGGGTALLSGVVFGVLNGISVNDWPNAVFQGTLLLSAILLIEAIALPLIFQFGATKSRYALIALMLIPSLLIVILSQSGVLTDDAVNNAMTNISTLLQSYNWLILPVCVVLFFLSGLLSKAIYSRKDL